MSAHRAHGRGLRLPYLDDMFNPAAKLRVRCAFCKWGGTVTTAERMREAHAKHMALKHPGGLK